MASGPARKIRKIGTIVCELQPSPSMSALKARTVHFLAAQGADHAQKTSMYNANLVEIRLRLKLAEDGTSNDALTEADFLVGSLRRDLHAMEAAKAGYENNRIDYGDCSYDWPSQEIQSKHQFGIPWSRQSHVSNGGGMHPNGVNDHFLNALLAHFLLGIQMLSESSLFEFGVPSVDPEIIEESFEQGGLVVWGAKHAMLTSQFSGYKDGSHDFNLCGAVRINVATHRFEGWAFRGTLYGTKKTKLNYLGVSTCVGLFQESPTAEYVMFPKVWGTCTYQDGSVYCGQFRVGGVRGPLGKLCASNGTVIYDGEWYRNPHGNGLIRVAAGVYHRGFFLKGICTSLDLDLVCDPGVPMPCVFALAATGVLEKATADALLVAHDMDLRMTGEDLLGVAQMLLAACS